ncbi:uncharacterized protein BX664DRAFT_311622 [Halteromyces radiatus]|uniref:uncharacterized protein n=1 Tax=Halteromyces radiatus TaxID=101107 RepID=UPI0022202E44|nr:uncharacterized protein BX664DRAFT_311622 [Halteromyces radiatus]KAI8096702.1 hypothetical protein BX664DRAFT_311622 [Halteromyces radiatus]
MPPSHWMTLMNDVTYIDSTYYQKNITPYNPSDDHTTGNPLPPLPPFTMTEKILTSADLQTIDKTMHVISLSQQNLIRLSPSIGLFTRICKLDLSNNKLSSIPTTIGYLYQLEALYLGNNQLDSLPDTIGYLTKLVELDVSHNQLTTLTPCMAYLKKLQALTVAHNQLQDLPVHLVIGLKGLTILDLSHNPITILPAEITQLHFLRRLLLEGCPLMDPDSTNIKPPCYPLVHSPPSLLEYCARTIVRDTKRHQYYQQRFPQLSDHLIEYLNSGTPCTLCHAPYFDTYVARGRLVERSNRWIPVEYRLCQAHFTDETNRLLYMFSSSSSSPSLDHTLTSSSPSSISSTFSWHRPYRPPLPQLPNKIKRKSIYNHSITTDSISTITETTTTAVMMESVIQQQQQQQQQLLMQDDTRMDPINNNGWRAHRMKVMNKNQSGFLSLTKLPSNGNRQSDDPQQQQQL